MSELEAKKAEFDALAHEISTCVESLAGSKVHEMPVLAIAALVALQRLQQGSDEDRVAAQKWLRGMWDNLDIQVIQPAFRGKKSKESMTAKANYLVLEAYFSGYGDVSHELARLREITRRHGLRDDPQRLEEVVMKLLTLIVGVTKLGGRIIG